MKTDILGRKQSRKHARDARDFNNIETRAVIKIPPKPPLQGKVLKEIHVILREKLACFLPFRAKDLTFWGRNYFFLILAHPVYKM